MAQGLAASPPLSHLRNMKKCRKKQFCATVAHSGLFTTILGFYGSVLLGIVVLAFVLPH
jgi:hypothetical protein